MEHFFKQIQGWFSFPNLYRKMVKKFPDNSHFIEVGTWLGKSASFMAVEIKNSNKKIKFDCVDTWQGSGEHSKRRQIVENTLYTDFLKNIEPVKDIITPIRMTSLEAVSLYADNSLDFVFIDASHDYENVTKDINAWYPKVKSGGVLAGHDYDLSWPGVIRAVDEFLLREGYTREVNSEQCWGIVKR